MKKVHVFLSIFLAAVLSAAFISCDKAGLGEEVDLEGPVLLITSHEDNDFVAKTFTLAGECSDNKMVSRIEVQDIHQNILAYGTIYRQQTWSAELSFDKDQDVFLVVIAYDEAGNTGTDSKKTITLSVDTEDPVLKNLYLRRNEKYTVNFKNLEELKNLKVTDTANKDYFQNEFVQFKGATYDNYYVQNVHLELYLEDNTLFYDGDVPQNMESVYTPCLELRQENVFDRTDGPYYVHPVFTVEDNAGNEHRVNNLKWFIWYPEYDKPHVIFSLADSAGTVSIPMDSDIPMSIFDDDGVESVYAALMPEALWTSFENYYDAQSDSYAFDGALSSLTDTECDGQRDLTRIISTSGIDAGTYVLACAVKDKKYDGTDGVWGLTTVPVVISTTDAPILVIESPAENEPAALTEGKKFTVSGYVMDNKQVTTGGWAWIPSEHGVVTSEQIDDAKKLLRGIPLKKETDIVCKVLDLSSVTTKDIEISDTIKKTYYKMSFAQEFDITADFMKGEEPEKETKNFLFYTKDCDGNEVFKTYRLGAYTAEPSVTVNYKEYLKDDDEVNQSGEMGDMATFTPGSTLKFSVVSAGASNVQLKSITGSYGVEGSSDRTQLNITGAALNSSVDFEISDIATDTRYTINLTVTDFFDNTTNVIKTIIVSALPELQRFSSGMKNGVILTAGTTLKMQAEFSAPVTINDTANAKVLLTNIEGLSKDAYAEYASGSGSDTIIFTYKVEDGAYTQNGKAVGSKNQILGKDGKALYEVKADGTNMLEDTSVIYIDAVAPALNTENCVPKVKSATLNAALDSSIELKYTENVVKENGKITIRRKGSWAIPPVLSEAEFTAVYNRLSDANKILMIGTATGESKLSNTTGQSTGPYLKTTHGLKLNDGVYVPDTSTKYVLKFDLDPHGTDQTVNGLRQAFESIDYHQTVIDVTSSRVTVNNNTVTVKTDSGFFIDGPEYEVLIEKGTFRDSAGNECAELKAGEYTFFTSKTGAPVIRTERYTHGWGAVEYDSNASNPVTTGAADLNDKTADTTTAPTGFIRVRIDSLTAGASIKYSYTKLAFDGSSVTGSTAQVRGACYVPEDFKGTSWSATKALTAYASPFALGSSSLTSAERYYIRAQASFSGNGSRPALSQSDYGTEGAYKTVIYYEKPRSSGVVFIQGRDIEGGVSITAGFPLRDADPDVRFSKACYEAQENVWVLVSYEFTGQWYIQSYRQNWQNNKDKAPETCSYGMFYYTYDRTYWDAQ